MFPPTDSSVAGRSAPARAPADFRISLQWFERSKCSPKGAFRFGTGGQRSVNLRTQRDYRGRRVREGRRDSDSGHLIQVPGSEQR
jgi:hypothetical protein